MASNPTILNFPQQNVKLICVYNFKGGVGKTFTSVNLSHKFSSQGRRTLIVDLDGQCSLSFAMSKKMQVIRELVDDMKDNAAPAEVRDLQKRMVALLSNEDTNHVMKYWRNEISPDQKMPSGDVLRKELKTGIDSLYLLNGSPYIYEVESWMMPRMDSLADRFKLINMITRMAETMGIEYVIVDLNPGNTKLNQSVLARANRLIVPMFLDEGSVYSVKVLFSWVLPESLRFLRAQNHSYNSIVRKSMILFNKYKKQLPKNHQQGDVRSMTIISTFWKGVIEKILPNNNGVEFMELSPNMESEVIRPSNVFHYLVNANNEQWKVQEFNANLSHLIDFIVN